MATTSTKSIAVRLPYDEYLSFLRDVTEAKLSVNDYLSLQIDEAKRVRQAEAQQRVLTQQVSQLQQEVHQQSIRAEEQRVKYLQEMSSCQQQADTNQQNQQTALEKGRVQLEKITHSAGEWQTYANKVIQQKTDLELTIKTQQQTRDQQEKQLTQLKAKNDFLAAENHNLQQALGAVKADRAALKQQALDVLDKVTALHDDSTVSFIPRRYWPILDEFRESVEARP